MKTTLRNAPLCALLLCAAAGSLPAMAVEPPLPENQLTLSASASVEVARDTLAVTFSTQREGSDAGVVQSQLLQALDAALVEARRVARPGQVEVSTGNFNVYARQPQGGGALQWLGTVELQVEGRDIEAISRLVGRIATLSVSHVGYSLSREARDSVQAEISAKAIARFRSQADAYAKAFGFSGYTLRSVEVSTQDGAGPPVPVFRAARAAGAVASEVALPAEAGRASVSATVSGTVQMK